MFDKKSLRVSFSSYANQDEGVCVCVGGEAGVGEREDWSWGWNVKSKREFN